MILGTLSSAAYCRTTLDLGIVKKSIVVDDVSSRFQSQCVQHMCTDSCCLHSGSL